MDQLNWMMTLKANQRVLRDHEEKEEEEKENSHLVSTILCKFQRLR
jgi:hypothetical protein